MRWHHGRQPLQRRLAARGLTGGPHPSVLESKMARLLRAAGLPTPRAEVRWGPAERYRLDFAYSNLRLVVEVNGWAYHSSPEQARSDAARRNMLSRAGWIILEFDWWVVTSEPERVVSEISAAFCARRGSGRRPEHPRSR
jgi:very-short-patch-repair endonuclease